MSGMMRVSAVVIPLGRTRKVTGASRRLRSSVAAIAILLVVGCASRRPVTVPFGEWSGHGTFFYDRWELPEKTETIHRDYPTRLSIKPTKVDDQPAIGIEIVSKHGDLPEDFGNETHLRLALVETKRLSNSIVLYRVAGPLSDPEPEEKPNFEANSPVVGASCMMLDGTTVLQITYLPGFVDVYRFRGRGLMKAGMVNAEDGKGAIHWVEVLVQREPVDLIIGGSPSRTGF